MSAIDQPSDKRVVNPGFLADLIPRHPAFMGGSELLGQLFDLHDQDYAYPQDSSQAYPHKHCADNDARVMHHLRMSVDQGKKAKRAGSDTQQIVAGKIRASMAASGMTLNAWANSNGLTQSTIHRIVNEGMEPTTAQIQAIARAMNMQPWQLISNTISHQASELARWFDAVPEAYRAKAFARALLVIQEYYPGRPKMPDEPNLEHHEDTERTASEIPDWPQIPHAAETLGVDSD